MMIDMEQLAELFKDRQQLLTAGLKSELVYELTKLLYIDYHVIEKWKKKNVPYVGKSVGKSVGRSVGRSAGQSAALYDPTNA